MKAMNRTATAPASGLALATLLIAATHPLPVHAETVLVGDQLTVVKSDVARPHGGMSMTAVEAQFGAPHERHETVGTPPITRWDYEHFAVFFEKDRVIDTVVLGNPSDSTGQSDSKSPDSPAPQATPTPAAPGPQTQTISAPQAPESTVLQPIDAGRADLPPQAPSATSAPAPATQAPDSSAAATPDAKAAVPGLTSESTIPAPPAPAGAADASGSATSAKSAGPTSSGASTAGSAVSAELPAEPADSAAPAAPGASADSTEPH
jgi:hypothetical protein